MAAVEHGDPAVAHGTGADPGSVRAATAPDPAPPQDGAPVPVRWTWLHVPRRDDGLLPREETDRRWPS